MEFTDSVTMQEAEGTLDRLFDLPQDPALFTDLENHLRSLHCFEERGAEVVRILKQAKSRWATWAGRRFWVQACISTGLQLAEEEEAAEEEAAAAEEAAEEAAAAARNMLAQVPVQVQVQATPTRALKRSRTDV
jgi:hypothetical protein